MSGKLDALHDFTKLHRKVTILVTAAAVIAVGAVIVIFVVQKNRTSNKTTNYREYTVSKGNVTVGTTESGTVSLDSTSVTFPVACKIDTVLVKAGTAVKKGTALIKLDLSSVSDSSSETRQKLEAAKISLQSALNDQKAKLATAKITYESSKFLATSAPITRQLTEAELQQNIQSAQTSLQNDQKSLSDYLTLQKSYSADYTKLQQLKQWRDSAQTSETSYTNQLSTFKTNNSDVLNQYNSLKSAMDSARTALYQNEHTTDEDTNDDADDSAYNNAKEAYNDYYDDVAKTIVDQENDLEAKVAEYTAEYNNYSSAYNDANTAFSDKYKSNASSLSQNDIDQKVATLQAQVKTDQYNLDKAQKTAQISSVTAQTSENTDLNTAANADGTYSLAVNQLQEAVTVAQDSVDQLQNQVSEIDSALNGSGVITAPCDGLVATIEYTNGTSVQADTAMMVITKTNTVAMSVSVSEDDIGSVSIGQDATLSFSAYEGSSVDAVVESITAEPARSGSSSVTYTVVVRSKGAVSDLGAIYEGMSGEATVVQKQAKNVLYVSNKAITFKNGVSSVLVKNADGTHTQKTVKTGFSDGTQVEITSGLESGQTVLAESAVMAS